MSKEENIELIAFFFFLSFANVSGKYYDLFVSLWLAFSHCFSSFFLSLFGANEGEGAETTMCIYFCSLCPLLLVKTLTGKVVSGVSHMFYLSNSFETTTRLF